MDPSTFGSFLLFFWSQITLAHDTKWNSRIHSLSLSYDVGMEGEETLLSGLGLTNRTRLTLCTRSCVKHQTAFLVFLPCTNQNPFDGSFLECWSVWISPILKSGLDVSKCRSSIVPLRERSCLRDDVVSLEWWFLSSDWICRSCICPSSFDGMWTAIDTEFSCSSESFAVSLYAHLSPNLHPPGTLNFVHAGTCQLHELHLLTTFINELYTM